MDDPHVQLELLAVEIRRLRACANHRPSEDDATKVRQVADQFTIMLDGMAYLASVAGGDAPWWREWTDKAQAPTSNS